MVCDGFAGQARNTAIGLGLALPLAIVTGHPDVMTREELEQRIMGEALPQILEGVPISYRRLHIAMDRPGFTLNPTSCQPMSVDAAVTSSAGTVATPSSRFQVGECGRLRFRPSLHTRLFGPTRRGAPRQLAVSKISAAAR